LLFFVIFPTIDIRVPIRNFGLLKKGDGDGVEIMIKLDSTNYSI